MRVLLTGGGGMLGSSITAALERNADSIEVIAPRRRDLDLMDAPATSRFIADSAPDVIVHAAAVVGGIAAKLRNPTRYLLDNIQIDSSVMRGAIASGVTDFLYVSSAVVYPEHYRQPLDESSIMHGPLEAANEGYALAKIAGTRLCRYISHEYGWNYRAAVPSNLYGPNDVFDAVTGHLLAAALAKTVSAKDADAAWVDVWGDGLARREFVYAPDLAHWLVSQLGSLGSWPEMLNIGAGRDHSITEIYTTAAQVVGFDGSLRHDLTRPTGTQQRLLDSSAAMALGWNPKTSLEQGMRVIYEGYRESYGRIRP